MTSPQKYVAVRYLPTTIGILTTIWYQTIVSSLAHITPYLSLTDQTGPQRARRSNVLRTLGNRYADSIFLCNPLTVARNRNGFLFFLMMMRYLMELILVPLKSVFIQIGRNDSSPDAEWTARVSPPADYLLIALYILLSLHTIDVLRKLRSRDTGMKWDPVSLADQLVLVQGSNVTALYQGLESMKPKEFLKVQMQRISQRGKLRLGYWRRDGRNRIWYGIAIVPAMVSKQVCPLAVINMLIV